MVAGQWVNLMVQRVSLRGLRASQMASPRILRTSPASQQKKTKHKAEAMEGHPEGSEDQPECSVFCSVGQQRFVLVFTHWVSGLRVDQRG